MATDYAAQRWTLDDEPIDSMREWLRENDDAIDPVTRSTLHMLEPGDSVIVGGGAGAEFILRRVA